MAWLDKINRPPSHSPMDKAPLFVFVKLDDQDEGACVMLSPYPTEGCGVFGVFSPTLHMARDTKMAAGSYRLPFDCLL